MRIHVTSDLHLDLLWEAGQTYAHPKVACDVVVLAGDIAYGTTGVEWAKATFPNVPVVYVLGNHDFYFRQWPDTIAEAKEAAAGSNVHVLENESVCLDGVTFLGATLWTDFMLFGKAQRQACEARARRGIRDFAAIRMGGLQRGYTLMPHNTTLAHDDSMAWLKRTLEQVSGTTVVATHHSPASRSVVEQFQRDTFSAAFCSAHDGFVACSGAKLWIHGHTHAFLDYSLGTTRVICNAKGYDHEATGYHPELVVDV